MAKNRLSPGKAAGGPGSRVLGKPTQYVTGQSAKGITPGHAAQLGRALGNHSSDPGKTTGYRGDPKFTAAPQSVPLGNATALSAGQGPGPTLRGLPAGGRTLTHGPVNPGNPPPSGELFPGGDLGGAKGAGDERTHPTACRSLHRRRWPAGQDRLRRQPCRCP